MQEKKRFLLAKNIRAVAAARILDDIKQLS